MLQPFLRFFLIAFVLYAGGAGAAPRVGEPAPDFTGVDTRGQTHRLADYRGKTVVLEWTNHDSPTSASTTAPATCRNSSGKRRPRE